MGMRWVKKKKMKKESQLELNDETEDVMENGENKGILRLIRIIYEMIVHLSDVYDLCVNDTPFIPHCTIMKLSFLRRNEMKKLIKYNKEHKIKLNENCKDLDSKKKKKKRRRNDYK